MKTLDKVLIVLGVFLLLFIATMIYLFDKYQSIPDTLVSCVLGTSGIEVFMTASITITKEIVKNKEKTKQNKSKDK